MVTMSLPLFSGRLAASTAAQTLAPVLIPARIPSSLARRRAMANALSLDTRMHSVIWGAPSAVFKWRLFGTKPAPVPWILWGPGLSGSPARVWEMTGESSGSTAMARKPGRRGRITSVHPVMVPPVPTAETRMSTKPSVSAQISSAVVRLWTAGLAGLLNCWGIHAPGVVRTISSALAMAPFIPSLPGVRTSFAPSMARRVRRSRDMVSGMVSTSLYPLAAATNARAMPVLPLVGSTIRVSGVRRPRFSASSIIAIPIRSFTLPSGLKNSHLRRMVASKPAVMRFRRTSGVRPTVSTMLL